MLRLLLSIFSIFAVQALDFQDALKVNRWTLKAAHRGVSKHVDVSWEDVKQIQDRYKAHRPMQIRNTDKQWSVDHAFKFLLKHGRRFEGASIKAQPKGFDFEGTLHGTQYKLQCTHRCRVHRLGDYRNNSLRYDTHKDDMTYDEWLEHYEDHRKLDLLAGVSIHPSADSSLNCLRVIVSQDCEAHGYAPLHNKQLCVEAMNDAIPEARWEGITVPVVQTASTLEGATSPDCSTDGHVIIYNERATSVYVVADGTVQTGMGTLTNWKRVNATVPGAKEAPGDIGCSKHEPCLCQYKKEHAKANYMDERVLDNTDERVLCDDVHDDYINRTALQRPHENMLGKPHVNMLKNYLYWKGVGDSCQYSERSYICNNDNSICSGTCSPNAGLCKANKCRFFNGKPCTNKNQCLAFKCTDWGGGWNARQCGVKSTMPPGLGMCHPAESIVRVQHPCDAGTCMSYRRMDQLKIGDMVESTPDVFEPIIAFSRRDSDSSANYYEFIADNRTTLHISKGHYLYVNKKLTLPKDVRLGDIVSTGETITDIRSVKKQGSFHPHTWSTKLVVNGVQTSTNTVSLELSIHNYISTPIAYILYKLDVPIDINHRFVSPGLKRGRQLSSWFDGLRSCLSHTFVAPFLEILFGVLMVPVFTCWVFPETLAVAAMGYYVYKERTKKI